MRKFVTIAVGASLTMWLLLYVGEASELPPPWGSVLWILTIVCPSVCFWFLMGATKNTAADAKGAPSTLVWTVMSAALICTSLALSQIGQTSALSANPAMSSAVLATYAAGLVLGLSALVRWPRARRYILTNRLLGLLALAATASLDLGAWVTTSIFAIKTTLGPASSVMLDLFCLGIVLLVFLALLNEALIQAAAAMAALVGLALAYFLPLDVFLSLWLNGVFFWPLVIFSALALEAVVLRFVRVSAI